MHPDLVFRIALTLVPQIGNIQARILMEHFPDAAAIFNARYSELERLDGIGSIRAKAIKTFHDFKDAEHECLFIAKYGIESLYLKDPGYPKRLLHCYDAPPILFYKGNADLNHPKIISIIGTRRNTEYGKHLTEQLISGLVSSNVLIISGLAFGIDAHAHRYAIRDGLPTIAVLAHGLDKLYPAEHSSLAKEMLKQGGLLTEFRSKNKPDRHNFPIRNRIVAGMADAVIVVETGIKGGSMITAELANSYNKDVFAFPGKITDPKSAGCHYLIKNNKAILLTDAEQLLECMSWHKSSPAPAKQNLIFSQLSAHEMNLVEILREKQCVHIDELHLRSGLGSSNVAAAILNLELQNLIACLPGKMFSLNS
jgi:DNA processing protein